MAEIEGVNAASTESKSDKGRVADRGFGALIGFRASPVVGHAGIAHSFVLPSMIMS